MRPAVWVVAIVTVLFTAGCSTQNVDAKKAVAKEEPVRIKTALAEARTVERAIMVTGSLQADEVTTASSEVAGRITHLSADFGQAVRKGQVIAELEPTELSLQLERTRASMAQAMARIGLEPGQERIPDSTPQTRQARAQMEDAKSKYENAEKLVKTGDISQERFTELEKQYRARAAALEATQDELRTQLAMIRSLQADVKLAEKRVRDAKVVAPFDGIVQQKHVSPGQYIKENVAIYTLVKTSPLRLRVDVPESAVSEVRNGTTLRFTTEAVPNAEFQAVVREINPSLDARSRTLTAEARLVTNDARLKPGSFVQVRLVTAAKSPVIAVPRAALYSVAGLNKFFTIQDGKAKEHKVGEILGANGWVELPVGVIPAGSTVAVSNVPLLTEGAPVRAEGNI